MPRKLTATTGILLALVFAGCGKDDSADTAAQSAATTTTPAATTTPATTTSGAKASKPASKKTSTTAKTSGSKSTATKPATSGTTKTATTSTAKKAATPTKTTTKKKPVGVTPSTGAGSGSGSGSTADPSSGTGSGPGQERAEVVSVLRRYYKAFIDKDGAAVCALLTSEGQDIMISDGGKKTCADSAEALVKQAGSDNLTLLETTRDGLHVDDITVTGNSAIAQIGETSRLRLVQENGRWLVRSPNVTTGTS